jgi:hypothetical protein
VLLYVCDRTQVTTLRLPAIARGGRHLLHDRVIASMALAMKGSHKTAALEALQICRKFYWWRCDFTFEIKGCASASYMVSYSPIVQGAPYPRTAPAFPAQFPEWGDPDAA